MNDGPAASSQLPTNLWPGGSANASTVSPKAVTRLSCPVWSRYGVLLKICITGRVIRVQLSASFTGIRVKVALDAGVLVRGHFYPVVVLLDLHQPDTRQWIRGLFAGLGDGVGVSRRLLDFAESVAAAGFSGAVESWVCAMPDCSKAKVSAAASTVRMMKRRY
jgi:hypothetical protein